QAVHLLREKSAGMKINRAYKCHGCIPAGLSVPGCVSACPTGALSFGNRLRMMKRGRERISEIKSKYPRALLSGMTEFGGLQVFTIFLDEKGKDFSSASGHRYFRMENIIYTLGKPFTFGSERAKRALLHISHSFFDV
ncbi:MAG TPA: hypothetical protein VF857_09525, partial [Spirochaetota bacterium]